MALQRPAERRPSVSGARPAFASPVQLLIPRGARPFLSHHRPESPPTVCAKKGSNRRKRRPTAQSPKNPSPAPTPASSSPSAQQPSAFASDAPTDEQPQPPRQQPSSPPLTDQLPVPDETRIRLPDLSSKPRRRRKKPLSKPIESPQQHRDVMPTEAVKKLTAAYRAGGAKAQKVIDELEKDPDYFLQTGNASGEYDFTSALIGTGKPNKQGVYVLPYLQSGHILLLAVVLLVSFVYYPGFPLTEADDVTRDLLKKGLAFVALFNASLSVFAYRAAKLRKQPPAFWALKTAFLGNIAFNELRTNAPIAQQDRRD